MYASEAKKSEFLVHLDRFSKYFEKQSKIDLLSLPLLYSLQFRIGVQPGRGVSEKVSAVSFCLGSGLFGKYNSD